MLLRISSALAAVLLLSGAALAAPAEPPRSAADEPAGRQVRLVATDALIGRDVVNQAGEQVGTLRYLSLDLDQGTVSHLVIDTSTGEPGVARAGRPAAPGAAEKDLLIAPWSIAEVSAGDERVIITATGQHLANAPRLKRQELNRLSEPTLATYVVDYWAPDSELAALERQPRQSDADAAAGRAAAQSRSGTGAGSASATPPAGATPSGKPTMLVGQEVVAEVVPPMFQLDQDLEGARVTDRDGQVVGEIHRIMIDADTGEAAFAVLEGTSAGTAPVPLEALEWTAKGSTMLTANSGLLQASPALTNPSGPVNRARLARLYQRFGMELPR